MASHSRVAGPLQKTPVPVSLIKEGDFIVDPWDYIWRVAKNVADTEPKRGKQIVLVQQVQIEGDKVSWSKDTYQLDYPAGDTERRYTEDEIKEMVS